jgi:sugar lactone lactonase YvrE
VGTCVGARCVEVLASGRKGPGGIAVNNVGVYWTEVDTPGSIAKVPKNGGAVEILATNQDHPLGIALDDASAYWTNDGDGSIVRVPLGGGTAVTLASVPGYALGIAVEAGELYWATGAGLAMAPVGGGLVTTLARQTGLVYVALDATSVYWTSSDARAVMKAPLAGGPVVTLVSSANPAPSGGVAVDATNVYWTTTATAGTGANIMSAPIAGGMSVTLATGQNLPTAIVVDNSALYWVNSGYSTASPAGMAADASFVTGSVVKLNLGGGEPTTISAGSGSPQAIAVDATSVYWTNGPDGTVLRATPK